MLVATTGAPEDSVHQRPIAVPATIATALCFKLMCINVIKRRIRNRFDLNHFDLLRF
jgi:hypothetical protein